MQPNSGERHASCVPKRDAESDVWERSQPRRSFGQFGGSTQGGKVGAQVGMYYYCVLRRHSCQSSIHST